uniref:EGF-like domain-containing protein n=1 Tax=Heterorhabditis bacteriophora TaxID=37862 RepID=A0A1I7WBE7_HETBA
MRLPKIFYQIEGSDKLIETNIIQVLRGGIYYITISMRKLVGFISKFEDLKLYFNRIYTLQIGFNSPNRVRVFKGQVLKHKVYFILETCPRNIEVTLLSCKYKDFSVIFRLISQQITTTTECLMITAVSCNTELQVMLYYFHQNYERMDKLAEEKRKTANILVPHDNYQDTMGSDMVAFYDVSMMNEYYNCKSKCPSAASAKCVNGGFPNPNQCSVCICPSGYGGNLCNQRVGTNIQELKTILCNNCLQPPGCGSTLNASSTFKTLSDTLGDGSARPKDSFTICALNVVYLHISEKK